MNEIYALYRVLCREGRLTISQAAAVLGLKAAATLAEGFGVAMLVPVFEMAEGVGEATPVEERSDIWELVASLFDRLGLPMTIEVLLAFVVGMVLVRQLLVYAHRLYVVAAQQRMTAVLRCRGTAACFAARLDYHDANATGAVVNDLAQETQRAVAVAFAVISAAGNLLLTSIYLIGMGAAAGWPALAVFGCVLAIAPMMRGLLKRTRIESESLADANRSFSNLLVERLRAVRLLKLTRTEAVEERSVNAAIEQARGAALALVKMQALIPLVVEPAGAVLLGLIFYGGVTWLALPFELVLVVLLVIIRLIPVVQEMAKAVQVFLSGIGSMRFVVDRFETARTALEPVGGPHRPPRPLTQGVRFEGVHYGYPIGAGRSTALRGLDALFEAGKMTAIVGPSGAGKSTLIDLIPQLRRPDEGRILIDGAPIERFSVPALREDIAFVPQAPRLIAGTIRDHIRFGAPTLADEAVREAAGFAGLAQFINGLPQGYDTPLGEDGVGLSGGQRQRLDLARAIAQGSQILILDEPSSNLDPESEEAFRHALDRLRRDRGVTLLVIAHRFVSIQQADRILVIEDGRATGYGTHAQLIDSNDWYRRAWQASALETSRDDRDLQDD